LIGWTFLDHFYLMFGWIFLNHYYLLLDINYDLLIEEGFL